MSDERILATVEGHTQTPALDENLGQKPIWHGLLAGVIAGLTSRLFVHPADTLKAQLQVAGALTAHPLERVSTVDAFRKVSLEGSVWERLILAWACHVTRSAQNTMFRFV
jgi:hypothetical protein